MSVDFPRAWEIAAAAAPEYHHNDCSFNVSGGGVLCDCDVLNKHPEHMDAINLFGAGGVLIQPQQENDMTTNKQLRELAEKATPGPWITHTDKWGELSVRSNNAEDAAEYAECGVFYELAERIGGHVRGDDFDDFSEVHANAQLIAAANPATVLALLDENEALQAECEKLRKDAARYRWLRSHDRVSDKHEDGMGPPGTVGMVFISQGDGYAEAEGGDDLDAAIDAAMQGANHGNQ